MREAPVSSGFLAFSPARDKALVLGNHLRYFASVFNGSYWLAMTRRDMDATWRTLGKYCRDFDRSKPRLLHELRNGLPYRTIPPGHAIDWHRPAVAHSLDLEASTVTIVRGMLSTEAELSFSVALDSITVGVEVCPPPDSTPAADASARWTVAAIRRLWSEGKIGKGKIGEGMTKTEVSRRLAAASEVDARAGLLRRPLKASYLENALVDWDLWPLDPPR
jgi:hypothetical protein